MAKTEGTYIWVPYKNVFGHISTNSWPFFMIQRPTIREECAWVRPNTWWDERPIATGLDRFFSVFRFFNKPCTWQLKIFRICATATGGPVFCSWVQFDFGLFCSPVNWTCEQYLEMVSTSAATLFMVTGYAARWYLGEPFGKALRSIIRYPYV